MKQYLFVYGTLLPEAGTNPMSETIRRLNPLGKGTIQGRLYDLGDYPGAILDSSSHSTVAGLVYELPDDRLVLQALDSYEGFAPDDHDGSLFVRTRKTAILEDGRRIHCWVYVYNRDPGTAPVVSSGDYQKHRAA